MKSGQRAVAILLFVGGLFFTFAIWGGVLTGAREAKFTEMMFPIALSLLAALFIIRSFRNRIRFSDHAIELHGLLGTRTLPFDKIRGRRRYFDPGDEGSPGVWHVVFESDDDRFLKIDIEESYSFDDAFYTWFKSLPDLDNIDKTRPKSSNFGLA
jgi:hypothetical protein